MRLLERAALSLACAWFVASGAGCESKDEEPPPSDAGSGGAAGSGGSGAAGNQTAGKGAGGSGSAGKTGGTSGSGTSGGAAGSGTAGGGTDGGGTDGGTAGEGAEGGAAGGMDGGTSGGGTAGGGSGGFSEVGVCGHRGEATVTETEFSGWEEYYLIGEEGFGDDICIVRFDVERTGDPPGDCPDCEWSHQVELSNPTVVLDTNGVCANSDLGFDSDRIDEVDGSRPAYGYVDEFAGHVSVLMKYDEERSLWDAFGTATYDAESSTLEFERRNGFCNYRP
ncbi:MAG TPA: hypothetical protein VGK73_26940 [Polyangiaceae bacterium]